MRGARHSEDGRAKSALSEANRTTSPSAYNGCTSREPGSRRATNCCHSRLELGGPTHSAPSTLARRSAKPSNAASDPCEPRLSPYTSSLGRACGGRAVQCSYTASNKSLPAAAALVRSARNDSTLGRYEYCVATIAVSPSYMYSIAPAASEFTHPVPVVVTTTSAFRSNAPVRSSSDTARSAGSTPPSTDSKPT